MKPASDECRLGAAFAEREAVVRCANGADPVDELTDSMSACTAAEWAGTPGLPGLATKSGTQRAGGGAVMGDE